MVALHPSWFAAQATAMPALPADRIASLVSWVISPLSANLRRYAGKQRCLIDSDGLRYSIFRLRPLKILSAETIGVTLYHLTQVRRHALDVYVPRGFDAISAGHAILFYLVDDAPLHLADPG